MSLDIYFAELVPGVKGVSFEANGYYLFLYPLFENLAKQTGQMIDLYGEAQFDKDSLVALKSTIEKAKENIDKQPDEWDVRTGWTNESRKTPMHHRVNKDKFLQLIGDFLKLVNRAIETKKPIRCVGD